MGDRSLIKRVENPQSLFNSILSSAAGKSKSLPIVPPNRPVPLPPVTHENLKDNDESYTEPLPDNVNGLLSKALIISDTIIESSLENNELQRYDEEGKPVFTPEELITQARLEFLSNLHLTKGYYDDMINEDESMVELNKQGASLEYLLNMEMPDYSQITQINDKIQVAVKDIDEIINKSNTDQLPDLDKSLPSFKKSVLSKEDSLYSSIFRAAQEQKLLTIIKSNLGVNIEDEKLFIQDFRNIVAQYLMSQPLPQIGGTDIFELLYNAKEKDYQTQLLNYPVWFQIAFSNKKNLIKNPSNKLEDKKIFISTLTNNIKKIGTYSCEIEVLTIEILLGKFIHLNIIKNPTNDMTLYTQILQYRNNETQNTKSIINLHNTNLVEYEYYSYNISQENFEKLKENYVFLNNINISNIENTSREIIASRNASIKLKTEQIRILDESIQNWNSSLDLFNYILTNDKYWTKAWAGKFPDEQEVFLKKLNEIKIEDYPEEVLNEKNSKKLASKKQVKVIDLTNLKIDTFKDIVYNIFTVLNSPETIEKRSELQSEIAPSRDLMDLPGLLNETNDNDDNDYDPFEKPTPTQSGGILPILAVAAFAGLTFLQDYRRKEASESINKIAAEQKLAAEHSLGVVASSNLQLPVKPDYLKYQSEHFLKMIDTTKQCLKNEYKPEFENLLKIIKEIYIPNITELKNLYTKEIEIYKIVIENKTKELLKEAADVLKIINANEEYKQQFTKYIKQLTDSDLKSKELIKKGFFSNFFEGGKNRLTRKQKNKKLRVTRYGSNKCRY